MGNKNFKKYLPILLIWLIFIVAMSLSVLMRIIDTDTYILYGLVVFYIIFIYLQVVQ
jgi:hypothetical protein